MSTSRPDATPAICILMGLFNGAPHLREQLDSFVAQTDPDWGLVVSDDGSTDAGPAVLEAFRAEHPDRPVTMIPGPCRGFARNFLTLLGSVPPGARYAALSDQDDVWLPEKLARGRAALDRVAPDRPALYCAATLVCHEDLRPIGRSIPFRRPPDFRNALVQSIGGGNTMMLNRAALDLAAGLAVGVPDPVAHDWWLYQVITGTGGVILRDPEPVLMYRQHGGNLIGANITPRNRLTRILAVAQGRFRRWSRISLASISPLADRLTPEAQEVLRHYRVAHVAPRAATRIRALRASGVYRQSRAGTLALHVACLLRRL